MITFLAWAVLIVGGFFALCLAGAVLFWALNSLPEILTLLGLWWLLHAVGCL